MIRNLARSFGAAFALVLLGAIAVLVANQSNTWSPTTGTVSGLQLTTNYNNAFSAIQSCNSGSSAPVNDQTLAAIKGQCWLDTSTTPNTVKMYDGASWLTLGWMDATNHVWIANSGGSTGTIASAGTTDLGTVVNQVLAISGTTTITSLGSTAIAGSRYFLNFTGILTLTHNASSLILPNGGSNITTAVGDTAIAEALGSGNWRVVAYQRASGIALSAAANFASTVNFNGVISPAALGSNTNNWAPAGLATANVIRLSCSTPGFNVTGLTAPVTDGQVVVLDNIGTFNCTFTSNDANSTAANQFAFDKPIALRPGRTLTIKYDITTARWVTWQEVPSQLVAGGFKNLRLLNSANALGDTAPATPAKQMKILLDAIALEDVNGGVVRIDSSYAYNCTVDLTGSTFNASTGGIDTGAIAATTGYYYWAIFNPTTNTPSCLGSLSSSAPTMPSGFTFKARVGWNHTDGSSNLFRVQQYGRIAHYVVTTGTNTATLPSMASGAAGTFGTSASITALSTGAFQNTIPATAVRINAIVSNRYANGTPTANVAIAPKNSADWTGTNNGPTGSNGNLWPAYLNAAIGTMQLQMWMDLDGASFGYVSDNAGGGISTWGWEDNL